MAPRFTLLLVPLLLFWSALAGCGSDDRPARAASHVDPGSRIRLIDRLADADLTSAVDLSKVSHPDQIDDAQMIDRIRVEGAQLEGRDASLLRAAADPATTQDGEGLDLEPGDILAYAFPASPGSLIRCTITASFTAGAHLDVAAYECESMDRARPIATEAELGQVLGTGSPSEPTCR